MMKPCSRGFTLLELVTVMAIAGILAATLTIFLKPVIDGYFDARRRADLADTADTALRRMAQDIRSAVPNSVRAVSASCLQLVPTSAGGRYRMAPDIVNDAPGCLPSATCSAWLDPATATTAFDVLSPLAVVPVKDDWIVVDNQNADDVYSGANRGQISKAPAVPARTGDGLYRITVNRNPVPGGYDGGRFLVVPKDQTTVFYSCNAADRKLYRGTTAGFAKLANQAACDAAGGAVVATDVDTCTFLYEANQGRTQQSGFVWMQLELKRSAADPESVALADGVHVDNGP